MKDGLYHKGLYWFTEFEQSTRDIISAYSKIGVNYTTHYLSQISLRNVPKIPSTCDLLCGEIIEVEVENGFITKALIRTKFNHENETVTVVKFVDDIVLYITGWVNDKNDNHNNMDTKKYILREENQICV